MLLAFALACTTTTPLENGMFALWSATVDGVAVDAVDGVVLSLDVETNDALFTLGSQTLGRSLFRLRDEAEWVESCSENLSTQRLQTVDLETDSLSLGDLVVDDPVMHAGCAVKESVGRTGVAIVPAASLDGDDCSVGTCLSFEDPFGVAE
jgi:hypothetical protein